MTRLILVRHGESVGNVKKQWHGWSDTVLTPLGVRQAEAVARRLAMENDPIAALYTSPLRRAAHTAEIIGRALGLEPIPWPGLKEIDFGQVDGLSLEEFQALMPELYEQWTNKEDLSFTWPGGERRADFFQRVAVAAQALVDRHPHDTIVVVAHGGSIRALLAHFLPEMRRWWAYELRNCSLTRLEVTPQGARLLVLNDCHHLPQEE